MHVLQFAFYTAGAYYALFVDRGLLLPFFTVIFLYMLISFLLRGAKDIPIRKKIMLATWSEPSEGVAIVKVQVRTDACN